jgi:hypothetical protein
MTRFWRISGRRPRATGDFHGVARIAFLAAISLWIAGPGYGQSQTQSGSQLSPAPVQQQKPDTDRPAPTCAKILQMTSSEWIANVTAIHDSSEPGLLRGISLYGDCYDARTKRLSATLAKSGKGPSSEARDDFRSFESALKDFTSKALATTDPPADKVKTAYAALYLRQFRYEFYQSYEPKPGGAATATHRSPAKMSSPAGSAARAAEASPDRSPEAATGDADQMTRAKNRFGELLDALPEDKLHAIHAAFGLILGSHSTTSATQLAVYRYAIFVLEPFTSENSLGAKPLAKPFSDPPF